RRPAYTVATCLEFGRILFRSSPHPPAALRRAPPSPASEGGLSGRASAAPSLACGGGSGWGLVSRGSPASFCGEEALGEAREKADPDRDRAVVEIVARVVQQAAALARAVADPQHRPRPRLQHVGEILAAERRRDIALDMPLAADLGRDVGGKVRFVGMVDRRRVAATVAQLRAGAVERGGAARDLAHAALDQILHLGAEAA